MLTNVSLTNEVFPKYCSNCYCLLLLYILLRGERDVRHADPYARLYFEIWSKHRQGRTVANRYNTDKAESSPKASVGRRSANNIQQGQGKER